MKKLFRLLIAATMMMVAGYGCEQPEDNTLPEEQLEVTAANLSGSWKLDKWNDVQLPESNFVYIDFERSDRTYTLYQNIDSFDKRTITGRYFIYVDETLGEAILRGEYDHGAGEWNHRYIVKSLTATTMLLVAKDNIEECCSYIRQEIPAEILDK